MNLDGKKARSYWTWVLESVNSASIYTKRHRCTHAQIQFFHFQTSQIGPFLGSLFSEFT
ncbi:hypothetical protein ACSS6W_009309 [Trichoderma asperelloides]